MIDWPAGSPAREVLQRLSQLQGVAILVDRRLDPDTSIQLTASDITLAQLLTRVADQCAAVVSHVDCVVYIGPRDSTANLPQVARQRSREVRAMPSAAEAKFSVARSWQWEELSEPRELLRQLAQEANIQIEGLDTVPHDLWPAADLPPLSWTDRMTLVLAGFSLTFEWTDDVDRVRLVPWPTQTMVARAYPVTLSQVNLDQLAAQFPHARIEPTAGGIQLHGTQEEHDRLQQLLRQRAAGTRASSRGGTTVHTLRVSQQPIGAILKTLAQKLELRFEFAPNATESLETRVSFDVREVPLDKLLDATLAPAGLTHRRDGEVIRIERL